MRAATVAGCALSQWALDFEGNLRRTLESVEQAKARGASLRVGPELELCGYSCNDHFYEPDTELHCWQSLAHILSSGATTNILCDFGMPIIFGSARFNCRVFAVNGSIVLIRPKKDLANDGNYREARWFTAWSSSHPNSTLKLPECIQSATGQSKALFGDMAVSLHDTSVATELCEELFTPHAPHIDHALRGIEIFTNGSASHHQLRKLDKRLELTLGPLRKAGGVYVYSNLRGCDGERLYFDGCACIAVNGELVAQGAQFSMREVEVVTATVDLDEVASFRTCGKSLCEQAAHRISREDSVDCRFRLCEDSILPNISPRIDAHLLEPQDEIARGPACWLWDYLRRSGASGFVLPLSGGADSSSTAAIVASMCQMAVDTAETDDRVASDVRRLACKRADEALPSAKQLANSLLCTLYLSTENSSTETRERAERIAHEIGSYHLEVPVLAIVTAVMQTFSKVIGKAPQYKHDGGSNAENLALQNVQARVRMVVTYLFAALVPWARSHHGFYLVLGSANVDESLWGYLTKYDCSSADINPIGGISKEDLRSFLRWAAVKLNCPVLAEVEAAHPTAELEPLQQGEIAQTDEEDMGVTYSELSVIGTLRKVGRCGPVSMFKQLAQRWRGALSLSEVAEKVKRFFVAYARNRHKMTVVTPTYHAEAYSPEDNRFDLRPFLYPSDWRRQFEQIDAVVAELG